MPDERPPEDFHDAVIRLSRDMRRAANAMSAREVRILVDTYYIMQDQRIRSNNQVKSMKDEPHDIIAWLMAQSKTLEGQVRGALDVYSVSSDLGRWCRSIYGVGPVITAGLLANIDMQKVQYAGQIWSYAGLTDRKWKKGEKRPWNARLKRLCFNIGDSFRKFHKSDDCYYGHLYRFRKDSEEELNANGAFADQAAQALQGKNWDKTTDAYKAYSKGILPPAHIDARARRYATKMFLSHYFHVGYVLLHGEDPPLPFAIAHLEGHNHTVVPPDTQEILAQFGSQKK